MNSSSTKFTVTQPVAVRLFRMKSTAYFDHEYMPYKNHYHEFSLGCFNNKRKKSIQKSKIIKDFLFFEKDETKLNSTFATYI